MVSSVAVPFFCLLPTISIDFIFGLFIYAFLSYTTTNVPMVINSVIIYFRTDLSVPDR